ncbi:acyl-CoA thioesterase [Streptomyces sp. NPDC056002]|uniref:acyl-CoA thioesterase n=1 Tax=Streptomyces sp. NPDC056002 TaxID=3345675 RepID=UPI0035DFFFA5
MYGAKSSENGKIADVKHPGIAPTGLVGFLSLERLELDLFRGWCHDGAPLRAFGGQVAAQALTAAGHSVARERPVHSLHGYFLRPGNTRRPIIYSVERLRDGHSYTARRVTAVQDGEAIFTLSASFKLPEDGPDRYLVMPDVPPPEDLPDAYQYWAEHNPDAYREAVYAHVMSMRVVPPSTAGRTAVGGCGQTDQYVWFRAVEALPNDPLLHVCALAYCSDLSLAPTSALDQEALYPLRKGPSQLAMASLDHAMWFHRPFRADDWLLFAQRSPSAGDGRGFNLGDFWTREGTLVASVVQEAVLRRRSPRRPPNATGEPT